MNSLLQIFEAALELLLRLIFAVNLLSLKCCQRPIRTFLVGCIMRKSSSIRFVTDVDRDLVLLKSVLTTFGHQPNTDWGYQADGCADVVIIDVSEGEHYISKLEAVRGLGRVVVFYAKEGMDVPTNTFLLRKPARARDVLSLLSAAEMRLAVLEKHAQSAATNTARVSGERDSVLMNGHKASYAY